MLGRAHYFLGMVALSVLWLGTLVWVMHEVNPAPKKDMNEIDFLGADIDAQYNIASSSDCRSACEAHPQCLAFTYVISERACWLKGAGFTSKTNVNAVSGAVNWTLANERRRLANQTRQWNAGGGGGGNGDFDEFLDDDSSASEFDHGDEGDGDGEGIVPDPDGDGLWSAQQPREPSAEELAKYNDSVSVFGDVVLFLDILGASECEGERQHPSRDARGLRHRRIRLPARPPGLGAPPACGRAAECGRAARHRLVSRRARLLVVVSGQAAIRLQLARGRPPNRPVGSDRNQRLDERAAAGEPRGSLRRQRRRTIGRGGGGGGGGGSSRPLQRLQGHRGWSSRQLTRRVGKGVWYVSSGCRGAGRLQMQCSGVAFSCSQGESVSRGCHARMWGVCRQRRSPRRPPIYL